MISIIAALADNNVIGASGTIPWNYPEDMRHFRALTMGKTVIVGRRTWESIPRGLPGRDVRVVSSRDIPGVQVYRSVWAAVHDIKEACIIGGARIYQEGLTFATHMHLTHVHRNDVLGDVFFPRVCWAEGEQISSMPAESKDLTFCTYRKKVK